MTTEKIPADAREVYCNEQGEPIAYCPRDSIGITDLQRANFYNVNHTRLTQLAKRAREKTKDSDTLPKPWRNIEHCVVCIDVEDLIWNFLVNLLMPEYDWDAIRARGEHPIARGVVPLAIIENAINQIYPAAGSPIPEVTNIAILAAGGAAWTAADTGSNENI